MSAYTPLSGDAARAYAFRHLYHTMFVGGMLCALMLSQFRQGRANDTWRPKISITQVLIRQAATAVARAERFCGVARGAVDSAVRDEAEGSRSPIGERELEAITARLKAYSGRFDRTMAPWAQALSVARLTAEESVLVLGDALLIHAAQHYELPMLAATLSLLASLKLEPSPTFVEAFRFLLRQQLPCGAIGAHFTVADNRGSHAAPEITLALAGCLSLAAQKLEDACTPLRSGSA